MTVKSRFQKFQNSLARFTIMIKSSQQLSQSLQEEVVFDIQGFIEPTSPNTFDAITFPVEVDLKHHKAPIGSDITLNIQLISGSYFKIIGMLFCT